MKYTINICLSLFLFSNLNVAAQEFVPEVNDASLWGMTQPSKTSVEENVVTIDASEYPQGALMALKDVALENGTIELDLKGSNTPGRSFVGLAFNIQSENSYEAIYFRPFNFRNPDKKSHAVQYINMPTNSWRMLRNNYPKQFENEILDPPNGDDWFHARIVLVNGSVKVFVNHETIPSLTVDRIPLYKNGGLAFWVGSNTKGSFKNLKYTKADDVQYGYNKAAGHYFESEEQTKLYYEIYGEGDPILMLHGGVYGYIDEYAPFINELVKTNQVICLATRGHVKSDIGTKPFSYKQRAADAKKLLDHLHIEKATVIGFSDGGLSGFQLAADYPEIVEKMVIIGAGEVPADNGTSNYTAEELMKNNNDFFQNRVDRMPEPERWAESVQMLNDLYNNHRISSETFGRIKSPVLLLTGSKDGFASPDRVSAAHQLIENSDVSIIPNCGHVVFLCNWDATWASIKPFLVD